MTKLMSTIYKNPVGRTFLGLIFAFIFGTSALFLTIYASDQLGKVDVPYQIKETYQFDQWTINYDFLTLDFPEGGYIIPGYRRDRISAILIIGQGTATFEASDVFREKGSISFPIVDEISEVVIPLHHEDFDRLKRDTIFVESETNYPNSYLLERLESSKELLFNLNVLGMEKLLPPTSRSVMVGLNTGLHGEITYREDKEVSLSSAQLSYSFKHPIGQKIYPIDHVDITNLIYNMLLLFAFLGLIAFLTTDFQNKQDDSKQYLDTVSAILHLVGFSLFIFLTKWLSLRYTLDLSIQIVMYLIPVIYIGYWLYIAKIPLSNMGLTHNKIIKSTFIALIIFYLLFLSTSFEVIPPRLEVNSTLFMTLFIVLMQQFILRGFIQNTLEALLNPWIGLSITCLITVAIFLIEPVLITNDSNLHLIFSGYFAISIIISYCYHRTGNIFTPTVLTLLLSLFISNLY